MDKSDIGSFFADEAEIDRDAHVVFNYFFETTLDPRCAAANLCRESSTAQWKRPGVEEDFRTAHAAKVLDLDVIDESSSSCFQDVAGGRRYVRARVRIAQPHINFGAKLPNLLTVAMGEGAFHSHGITAIKLLDIEFPDAYLDKFEGPRFGTKGLRNILGVHDRPLFFGVVKPNVGLDPASFAGIAREAWEGGLDAAKDDEMLADAAYSPFAERMRLVGEARRRAEDVTGRPKIFVANATDEVASLKRLHDEAVKNGINALMLNVMAVGLSAVRWLRSFSEIPIVAHFDCIAPMSRHPNFGVASSVITKLERVAGCDAIIMPGFGERMMTSDEEVLANSAECTRALGTLENALPVPGGSDWAGTLAGMYERLRTIDFGMVPGRGVFGHPMGPKAGAASLTQAWEAIVRRVPLTEYAESNPELAAAIAEFGGAAKAEDAPGPMPILGYTGVELTLNKN